MTLIYNATFDKTTRKLSFEDRAGNEIYSFTVPERAPAVDDITKPLTFKSTQDGSTLALKSIRYPSGKFEMSRDGGNTWRYYPVGGSYITLNTGDEVSFRAESNRTSAQNAENYFYFEMTGKIEAWHNVMSMYRTNDFATYNTVVKYAFLAMFSGCKCLTKAPALPATALSDSCYKFMFSICPSLTKAPELPATTLANSCCYEMFRDCPSLKEVRISATTTAPNALKDWLKGVSATGDFYCDPNATIFPTGASGIPEGWRRIPPVDDVTKPLTFKATQDNSTVALYKARSPSGSFQTSRDGGNTWEDYTIKTAITLNTGEEVSFRAKSDRTSNQGFSDYFYFMMTGKIEAWHNVMSLYRTSDFATYKTVVEYSFSHLFYDCKSLTKAPALPATTLSDSCYWLMFGGCQSLTKAPELTATTLGRDCFYQMFYNCSSLNEVRCKIPSSYSSDQISSYAGRWIEGVPSTGTFYTNADANWPSGINGIPTSWTRVNA